VQARGDLTGTRILGTSNQQGGCQTFAVFAGNQYTKVGSCDHPDGHDHIYAQQYPLHTWGKEFIVVSFATRTGGDLVKVLAAEDNTTIQLNATSFILNKGEYKKFTLTDVNTFRSDKPIAVGQFSRSQGCDNTLGDPFFILISPVEQMLEKITFMAPTIATVVNYPMSIILKTTDVPSIRLDGNSIAHNFSVVPGNPTYSFARVLTIAGIHTLQADGGFIAYIYGYGSNESFGYTAGASLENLKISIAIKNSNGKTIPADSICLNDVASFTPIVNGLNHFEWFFGDGGTEETLGKDPVDYKFDKAGKYIFKLKATIDGGTCTAGHEETYVKVITVINPKSKILGPRSICPNTNNVSYYADKKRPYTYYWKVKGGIIKENHGDSIVVDWGGTNANAYVKLLAANKFDCAGDTVTLPIKINVQLDPDAPTGPDTLCSSSMTNIEYKTFLVENSQYMWGAQHGIVKSGQGSSKVTVDWQQYGTTKLWFEQTTTNADICGGTSDTLYIYIQRDPSPDVTVISDKGQYQIGEIVNLDVTAVDPLYQMMNWNFGDNTHLDSLVISPATHKFTCAGLYDVSVNVYDTIGICQTSANGIKQIEVLPLSFEMIQVSTVEPNDSLIQILWKTTNTDFVDNPLKINKRPLSSNIEAILGTFNNQTSSTIDNNVNTFSEVYEYQLSQTSSCPDQDPTDPQHNIVLTTTSEDNLSAQAIWNTYDNWKNGVDHYEVYVRKDKGDFNAIDNSQNTTFSFTYDSLGFDYCFRIKAIENGGNNAFSWSNISCVQFAPPVETYNVITPNNDNFNDLFLIKGIEYYPKSLLTIYNRWGRKVKEFEGYKNNWPYGGDNDNLSPGVYFYVLTLRDARAKQGTFKGPLSILK
jgi:gliding motility-associated-like protein